MVYAAVVAKADLSQALAVHTCPQRGPQCQIKRPFFFDRRTGRSCPNFRRRGEPRTVPHDFPSGYRCNYTPLASLGLEAGSSHLLPPPRVDLPKPKGLPSLLALAAEFLRVHI